MRPENKKMQEFLKANGVLAEVKYIWAGSMKRTWRLTGVINHRADDFNDRYAKWTPELADKINRLGFTDFDHTPLDQFSGNGGIFSVFVRGHYELLTGITRPNNP